MTTIDKIRAEIERLYDGDAPKHDQQCDFDDGYFTGIATIGKFLDTLEEPVSDCNDLEEAAENSWVDYEYREDPRGLYSSCYVDGFKAGAEWQKAKMMKEGGECL